MKDAVVVLFIGRPRRSPTEGTTMTEPMLGRDVDRSEFGKLDTFPINASVDVTFETAELQALCPAVPHTQPDIYRCVIEYHAETVSIESKSLKLWLVTFRERRIFAENLAAEIGCTIDEIEGLTLSQVTLKQNIRGGLVETVRYYSGDARQS